MNQESLVQNPFMMLLNPELVVAAMEGSEKLGRLNRRMCHPLDRVLPAEAGADPDAPALERRPIARDD